MLCSSDCLRVQFFSTFFIQWDGHPDHGANPSWPGMYYDELKKGAKCRNSNIIEETGQVEFVLSDKTGTLTQNKMQFLKCVIAGESYGKGVTEVQKAQAKLDKDPAVYTKLMSGAVDDTERLQITAGFGQDEGFIFYDENISGNAWCNRPEAEDVRNYLRALALCNGVKPSVKETKGAGAEVEGAGDGKIEYSADNPDGEWSRSCLCIEDELSLLCVSDEALVRAAKNLGIEMRSRDKRGDSQQQIVLLEAQSDGPPVLVPYTVLETMKFSSYRKRMDFIIQSDEDAKNGMVTIFVKGADSHVRKCLSKKEQAKDSYKQTDKKASKHADEGLRTLFVAQGKTTMAEYQLWQKEYTDFKDRQSSNPSENFDAEINNIEQKLEKGEYNKAGCQLLGSTALEVLSACLSGLSASLLSLLCAIV